MSVKVVARGVTYYDDSGRSTFTCDQGATKCTIKLAPSLDTAELQLLFKCPCVVSGCPYPAEAINEDGYLKATHVNEFGFASNGDRGGAKLLLRVALKTLFSSFAWDSTLRTELENELSRTWPTINCTAVMWANTSNPMMHWGETSNLHTHFEGWKTQEYGAFAQEPPVGSAPEVLMLQTTSGSVKVNVTAIKKKLVTPGESIIEKRLVCYEANGRKKECCGEMSEIMNEI